MKQTTLCYIFCQNKILMLHRVKKKNDENEGKYIGLGGHFLEGETPLECVKREVFEESGILLDNPQYNGIVTFHSNVYPSEQMHLFTAYLDVLPSLIECSEGEPKLIEKDELLSLKMWEGDLIFLSLLFEKAPFFNLTLRYQDETLIKATLNGRPSELLEILDAQGQKTGRFKERSLIHRDGDRHGTVHIWIYKIIEGKVSLLLQKRANDKDAFPGMLDISCAGHLSRGDDYESAAKRELEEELSLGHLATDLVPIGFFDRFVKEYFYEKPFFDNERSMLYLLNGENVFPTGQAYSNAEVSSVEWVELDRLLADHTLGNKSCIVKDELDIIAQAINQLK